MTTAMSNTQVWDAGTPSGRVSKHPLSRTSTAATQPAARTAPTGPSTSAKPLFTSHDESNNIYTRPIGVSGHAVLATTIPAAVSIQQPIKPMTKSKRVTGHARPGIPQRMNSVQTRYMEMLLGLDTIPRLHNIYASFFTWLLLAGFIIFPGTFTSLQSLDADPVFAANATASALLGAVKHIQLLVVAGVCCGVGALGMIWLWWTWQRNYVWLLNRIFLPGALNSLAGLISTITNVYAQQNGNWSLTAEITAIVTGACLGTTAVLFVVYNNLILTAVKRRHGRDMQRADEEWSEWRRRYGGEDEERPGGREEEGFVEKLERKAREPALEPGSVV